MTEFPHLTLAESKLLAKKRRGRNIAMLIALCAICVLFYALALVKLSGKMGVGG
jgi:hypothetical protein